MNRLLILILCIFSALPGNGQLRIPEGFTKLTESPANGQQMQDIVYDFDGDGQKDYVTIVAETEAELRHHLMIYLSGTDTLIVKKLICSFDNGDGYTYPVQLKRKKNTLEYGYFSGGTAAFGRFIKLRYDSKAGKFRIIGYDSGYRIMGGHFSKTYNLLTGDYNVTLEQGFPKESTKFYKDKKTADKIYVDGLNADLIRLLDDVGDEYLPEHYR